MLPDHNCGPNGMPSETVGISKARLYQKTSWTSGGTPRKNQIHSQLADWKTGLLDSRMIASTTPMARPKTIARKVRSRVRPSPAKISGLNK